jgi:hypothetical protein
MQIGVMETELEKSANAMKLLEDSTGTLKDTVPISTKIPLGFFF